MLIWAYAGAPDAEVAIEVDPRVTTREQLETLAELSEGVDDVLGQAVAEVVLVLGGAHV